MTQSTTELWRDPRRGDVLTMRDGRKRTLVAAYEYGAWTEMIVVDKNGQPGRRYGTVSGWKNSARRELAKGGSYERPAKETTT